MRFGFNCPFVVTFNRRFQCLNRMFNAGFFISADLIAQFFQRFFSGMYHAVRMVASMHQFSQFAVFIGMRFGIFNHAINFVIRQTAGGFDNNRLFFAGRLVFGRHVQNTVGIDVECDFNLRHTARCRRNIGQIKTAQRFIRRCDFALTLQYMNSHCRLIVIRRRENLRCIGWNRGVFLDQFGHYAAHRLDTQR